MWCYWDLKCTGAVAALSGVPLSGFAPKVLSWQLSLLDVSGGVEYQWCGQTWDFCVPAVLLSNKGMDDLLGVGKTKPY